MADKDSVRLPRQLVVQLLSMTKRCLAQLDEVSRTRWEFNKVRLELEGVLQRRGLGELVDRADAGAIDTVDGEKTPVRRPSAALRAAGLADDEPTRPDLPNLKRGPR